MKTLHKIFFIFFFFFALISYRGFTQFSFVHIADIHVADGLSAGGYDVDGVLFAQMLNTINNLTPKPAFVIATGDISNAGNSLPASMYPALTKHLYPPSQIDPLPGAYYIDSTLTIPIYFVPGNHDYRIGNVPPLSSDLANYSHEVAPDEDYYFIYDNAVFLCMRSGYDDLRSLLEDANYMNPEGSGFSEAQCSWARDVLSHNSEKIKIIAMHHPLVDALGTDPYGNPYIDGVLDTLDGSIKYNRTEFLNICDSNNVDIVVEGHEHQDVVTNRAGDNVGENWTESTRYVQTGSCLNGTYRIITVGNSFVSVGTPQLTVTTDYPKYQLSDNSFNVFYDSMQKNLIVSCDNLKNQTNIEMGLYNIMGQQIFRKNYNSRNGKQIIINTENISKGICLLSLQCEGKIITKKVVLY